MNDTVSDPLPMLCSPPAEISKERTPSMAGGNGGCSLRVKVFPESWSNTASLYQTWWADCLPLVQGERALHEIKNIKTNFLIPWA